MRALIWEPLRRAIWSARSYRRSAGARRSHPGVRRRGRGLHDRRSPVPLQQFIVEVQLVQRILRPALALRAVQHAPGYHLDSGNLAPHAVFEEGPAGGRQFILPGKLVQTVLAPGCWSAEGPSSGGTA